jgi:hypothetical protein
MEPGLEATRDELRRLLGEPDDVGGTSRKHPTPVIWKYGDIEYHFDSDREDGRVFLIYTEDGPELTPRVIAQRGSSA